MEKKIISAKEIATYVHCPESWRLRFMQKEIANKIKEKSRKNKGDSEDKIRWLTDFDAARRLTWAANVVIFLIFFLVVFFFLSRLT